MVNLDIIKLEHYFNYINSINKIINFIMDNINYQVNKFNLVSFFIILIIMSIFNFILRIDFIC